MAEQAQLELGAWSAEKDYSPQSQSQSQPQPQAQPQSQSQSQPLPPTLQWIKDKLVQSLPAFNSVDINDLKARGLALWIAAAHLALYLAVGLYFISTVTTREYGRKFLSPSADTGSVCEKIPVAVTGNYLADKSGIWQTNKAFDPTKPLYQLTLTGTKVTEEEYTRVMKNFTEQLQEYGNRTASLDVLGSQIAGSLFRASDANSMMLLETSAQLGQIFANVDATQSVPVFSSIEGVCKDSLPNSVVFDPAALTLRITVPGSAPPGISPVPVPTSRPTYPNSVQISRPQSYEFCPAQVSVSKNTFDLWVSPTHSVDIDLVSALTVFALNFGIINTSSLTKTGSWTIDLKGEAGVVRAEIWVDDRYPNMTPVQCLSKPGAPRLCLGFQGHSYGGTYYYPVLSAIDYWTKQVCECPRDAKNLNCNAAGSIHLALVFHKDRSFAPTIVAGWALQRMMQRGTGAEGEGGPNSVLSLVSGLVSTAFTLSSNSSTNYDNWKLRGGTVIGAMLFSEFAAGFKLLGSGISIMSVKLYYHGADANLNAQGVTLSSLSVRYNVSDGQGGNYTYSWVMCTDTIYQSLALEKMSIAPPVSVVQPYLSCHPTLGSAFVTAAGLASANSALVSSIFLVTAVFLAVQYINSSGKIVPPADKALGAAETEKFLLAKVRETERNEKVLFDNDDKLIAKYESVAAELAAIKALLTHQTHSPLPPTSSAIFLPANDAEPSVGNPLHRRNSPSAPAARLSLN